MKRLNLDFIFLHNKFLEKSIDLFCLWATAFFIVVLFFHRLYISLYVIISIAMFSSNFFFIWTINLYKNITFFNVTKLINYTWGSLTSRELIKSLYTALIHLISPTSHIARVRLHIQKLTPQHTRSHPKSTLHSTTTQLSSLNKSQQVSSPLNSSHNGT